jgi:single-stranded-DNA-specific exonuclease
VEAFAASGVRLIVTVDTGSTAVAEVAAANDAGIQTVITDHHLLDGVRPEAAALVNPQAGAEEMTPLAGAGVAYKLAQALYAISGGDCPYDLLALAALGTIADSAPLIGENRLIVRLGLEELGRTRHPGLSALLDVSRPGQSSGRPDAELVSFYISPRLNAPGRLGDAEPSLRILTTSSHEEARVLAARLEAANNERRKLGEQLWRDVEKQLERQRGASMVTVRCDGYPAGMLGPLAGKLSEQYRLPAVAYSVTGGVARASMRSVPGFDVHAALSPVSETLTRFGGHAAAAGFMVDEGYVDAVLAELERQASWSLMGMDTEPVLEVDSETPLGDMGASLWDFVGAMEPFGQSNSKPVFVSRGVVPTEVKTIGAGGRHLRMKLEHEGRRVNAIGFGLGQAALGNGRVDVAYELRTDTWNGRIRKELGLLDIRSAQRA